MIRRILLALAWVAAAAMFLTSIPNAKADSDTDAFIEILHERGIRHSQGDYFLVAAGHEMCMYLDAGFTRYQVMDMLYNTTGLTSGETGYFLGASMAAFCPWQM